MQKLAYAICALLLLSACEKGTIGRQWLDPDKEAKGFGQPDVPTQRGLLEKSAQEALDRGEAVKAAQIYKQLVEMPKVSADEKFKYEIAFSDAVRRGGDYEKALKLFEELNKEHPKNAEVLEGVGLSQMALGKPQEAGRSFKDVMQLDKKRWRTLNALGILFATKNMVPESMAYFAEALRVSEDNPAVLNNVGLSQAIAHNYPRALQAMQQAVRVAPSDMHRRQVELNMALIQGISGDLDGARATASKYLSGAQLDNNMGLYAYLSNNKELAKTYLNQALTGSVTYYERAWKNLDVVNETAKPKDSAPAQQ